MNKRLVLTTLALGVGASSASAAPFPVAGSDTLRELSIDVLAACPNPGSSGGVLGDGTAAATMVYPGGGSSAGGLAMSGNATVVPTQQLSPQSRFMSATECQINNPAGGPTNTGSGRALAMDGLAIWKDKTEHQFTCAGDPADCHNWPSFDEGGLNVSSAAGGAAVAANPNTGKDCRVIRYAGCMTIQDLNGGIGLGVAGQIDDGTGAAGVLGPTGNAAVPLVGGQYCFTHWADALRMIYCGQHQHAGASDAGIGANGACAPNSSTVGSVTTDRCNSDVRRTLVENWSNIFDYLGDDGQGGCTDKHCTRLKHAWRRDDFSGTTDAFLSLISCPSVGTAAAPVRTFCNGVENEDNDPIRRECNRAANASNDPDGVCSSIPFANRNAPISATDGSPTGQPGATLATPPSTTQFADLGLVLPISLPAAPAGVTESDWLAVQYNNEFCAVGGFGGAFKFAPMPVVALPAGQKCPDGNGRVGGQCRWPVYAAGVNAGRFNCTARRTNRPGAIAWANFDARAYNLTPRDPVTGAILQPNAQIIADARWGGGGHYRIHHAFSKPSQTGAVLKGVHPVCKLPDATEQIGCLVQADMCSIGFAGLSANDPTPASVAYTWGSQNLHSRQYTGKSPTEVGVNWPLVLRAPYDPNTADTAAAAGGGPRNYVCSATPVDGVPGNAFGANGWWGNPWIAIAPENDVGGTAGQEGDYEVDPLVQLSCNPALDGQPNDNAVLAGLQPSGAGCGAYKSRYPLARILWLNSSRGLANVTNGVFGANDLEARFRDCYMDPTIVTPALIEDNGFIPLPGGVGSITKSCP